MKVAQIAPAVRVSIGEMFGLSPGDYTEKLVGLLYELGFDEVVETPFGADIITYLEALEFDKRLKNGPLPLLNSCCVGWREFLLRSLPDLRPNLSNLVSPMMAAGAITKLYFSKFWNKSPEDIEVVGIMPCTIKKNETKFQMSNGLKYVDEVITTTELANLVREKGIKFKDIKGKKPFKLSLASKDGVIFGATGGISEAILTSYASLNGESLPINREVLRSDENTRVYKIKIAGNEIKMAIVFGFPAFMKIKNSSEFKTFHFIEVMMCPFGCVGGPGQPTASINTVRERARVMREIADNSKVKLSPNSKNLQVVEDFLKDNLEVFKYDWSS